VKEFSIRLKKAREEKGLSQRSLGLSLGLSDKTISSYESQRSFPNLEVLRKIAEILGKPIEYFISSKKEVKVQDSLEKILQKQTQISKEIKDLANILKKVE